MSRRKIIQKDVTPLSAEDELAMGKTITHEYLHYHNKYSKIYGKDSTIVLICVGAFLEMYSLLTHGPDLDKICDVLNLIRTRKDKSKEISFKNPFMCGFNKVSMDKYIKLLVENNYTVVVIDQITDPPNPKRGLTGIYSAGTYIDTQSIYSNYTMCLYIEQEPQSTSNFLTCIGLSTIDVSTGLCSVYETYS